MYCIDILASLEVLPTFVCHSTCRGERGGGGAFRLRGVVPPCIDEVADGTWECCGGGGESGSQTGAGRAQHKTRDINRGSCGNTKGQQQRGTRASEKRAAHFSTMISYRKTCKIWLAKEDHYLIWWGVHSKQGYGTLPPRLWPQKLRVQGERQTYNKTF